MDMFCAVILARDLDNVTGLLIQQRVLHLVRIRDLEDWARGLGGFSGDDRLERSHDLQKRVLSIMRAFNAVDVRPDMNVRCSVRGGPEGLSRRIKVLEKRVGSRLELKGMLLEQLNAHETLLRQLESLGPGDVGRAANGHYTFLEAVLVKADQSQRSLLEQGLSTVLHVLYPLQTRDDPALVLVLVLKKDALAVEKALVAANIRKVALSQAVGRDTDETRKKMLVSVAHLRDQVRSIEASTARDGARLIPVLERCYSQLFKDALIAEAQGYFQRTARTYVISGWLPRVRRDELSRMLRSVVDGRCCLHGEKPGNVTAVREKREKVPVLLDNPRWLKPFELIVTNYDLPEYGSIDPTLFVAVSFFLMFGIMFGDVGQGLVLVLVGCWLAARGKGTFSRAGSLVAYAGASATVFGALYGNFFGMDNIIPVLWMRPQDHLQVFFPLAIIFGIVFISLGIVFNIINAVTSGDVMKGVFGISGLIGGLIYWAGIALASRYLVFKVSPAAGPLVWLIAGLVLLLFMKAPFEKLIAPRERMFPEGIFAYLLETAINGLEIGMGYLANTLSYIRLVAFALAHAGLFLAVFTLADMVKGIAAGGMLSVLIIVIGNILILGLEGMIVAIQGIRLEYYEFFSKFFSGGGKMYRPLGSAATI